MKVFYSVFTLCDIQRLLKVLMIYQKCFGFIRHNFYWSAINAVCLSPSFGMVQINFNDFMDLFSNLDVENKFSEMLSENANAVIIRTLAQKLMDFFYTRMMLQTEFGVKNASIDNIYKENQGLCATTLKLCVLNVNLLQKVRRYNLVISDLTP